MPTKKTRISTRAIEQIEQGAILWDDALAGFGARRAGSFSTFFYNYRLRASGKMKRVVIGRSTEMTPTEARDRAVALAAAVRAGDDPSEATATPKQRAKMGNTLGQAVEAWLNNPAHDWAKKTRDNYRTALRRSILDNRELAGMMLTDVGREHLVPAIDKITQRSAAAGALAYRALKSFLAWQEDRGMNPVSLPRARRVAPQVKPRERMLTDAEIKSLWHAADSLTPLTAAAGRLVLLTAQRSGAMIELRRSWITENLAAIEFPAEVMKGARRHRVPLGDAAQNIVARVLEEVPQADHLFGAGSERLKQALPGWRSAAGIEDAVRLHDVRRSLRTWAAANGYPDVVAEAAIAHQVAKDPLSKVYQLHAYEKEAAELLLAWQAHVEKVVR